MCADVRIYGLLEQPEAHGAMSLILLPCEQKKKKKKKTQAEVHAGNAVGGWVHFANEAAGSSVTQGLVGIHIFELRITNLEFPSWYSGNESD